MNKRNRIIIERAFYKLEKKMPLNEEICIYKSGLVDSFELMQIILEIELMANISIDLEKLTNGSLSIQAIDKHIDKRINQEH